MTLTLDRPLAVLYEHPHWFTPLFAEFDRRAVPYVRLLAQAQQFDPAETIPPYSLVFCRMSPSAYTRGHAAAMAFTTAYLAHLDACGVPLINGVRAYEHEFSKARQLSLLHQLGMPYPAARVVNHISQLRTAATELTFPLLLKANVGGSGAGIQRFDAPANLEAAAAENRLDFGPDGVALLQRYLSPRGQSIVRVEVLGGRFLYAIRLHLTGETFNLCPASYCRNQQAEPGGSLVEGYTPPPAVIAAVETIMAAAGIDVGGIEYLINDDDGELYFYDINAMSNFVADAPRIVGFDPWPRLVDYLIGRAH